MQLQRLKIDNFRNLRDFEITFTASVVDPDEQERELKSHAVIGQNGSGKSNLVEAIVTIFRDLDLNQNTEFGYELDYEIRDYAISIKADAGQEPKIVIDGVTHDPWIVSDIHRENPETGEVERGKARRYLPSNVFTYYSGKSERLEALFQDHQRAFIENINEYNDDLQDSDALVRRLFYCRHPHSKFSLLACLLAPEKPLKKILDDLQIVNVDSVLFVLKQPYRLSGDDFTEADIERGNIHFWFDNTRFSEEFLEKLWELAIAPIDFTEEKTIDFRGRTEEQALLYLFVENREKLNELKEHIGDSYRFFRYLEGSYIADLVEDLKIYVEHQTADGLITFEQLSEGELQLLTVLGLMRLTHEDHCLFLLDEPDTHLNPLWKLRYFEEIENVLDRDSNNVLQGDSQIIITTHDPMMVGSLRKEQVRILRNEGNQVTVEEPDEHPRGMGVAGLLKSELFGLPSTLDNDTLQKLERRNELIAKSNNADLTEGEQAELSRLRDYLDDLGFREEYRDPLYQMFVEKLYNVRSQPLNKILNKDELIELENLAERIVKEVVKRERSELLSDLAKELNIQMKK